jgi:hypothetical protein
MRVLNALKLEDDWSETIRATIYGNTLFLIPRKISTECQCSDVAVDRVPSSRAEILGHLPFLGVYNELLAIPKHLACSKGF